MILGVCRPLRWSNIDFLGVGVGNFLHKQFVLSLSLCLCTCLCMRTCAMNAHSLGIHTDMAVAYGGIMVYVIQSMQSHTSDDKNGERFFRGLRQK